MTVNKQEIAMRQSLSIRKKEHDDGRDDDNDDNDNEHYDDNDDDDDDDDSCQHFLFLLLEDLEDILFFSPYESERFVSEPSPRFGNQPFNE